LIRWGAAGYTAPVKPAVAIALVAILALPACLDGPPTAEATAAVTDPISACPIPDEADLAGHEAVFYECAEATARCGPDGYLLGYGARYARRFYRETRARMTRRGQQWIDDVLVCLQRDLRASIDSGTSCPDIRTIAFDTHPACYVENGFCTLSPWDVAQVVWSIDSSDLVGRDAARQVVTTALDCGDQYAGWIRGLFWYLR
jgi:hypothetical protein